MEFNTIFKEYWPKVFRLCKGYLGSEAAAQDVAQDSFITIWQQLDKLRHPQAISTWIYRIAANNCLLHLKKSQKDRDNKAALATLYEEDEVKTEDTWQAIQQALAHLPDLDRMVVTLYLEEVPQREIAEITGLSPGNVRVRLHRIKKKLSEKMKTHE